MLAPRKRLTPWMLVYAFSQSIALIEGIRAVIYSSHTLLAGRHLTSVASASRKISLASLYVTGFWGGVGVVCLCLLLVPGKTRGEIVFLIAAALYSGMLNAVFWDISGLGHSMTGQLGLLAASTFMLVGVYTVRRSWLRHRAPHWNEFLNTKT